MFHRAESPPLWANDLGRLGRPLALTVETDAPDKAVIVMRTDMNRRYGPLAVRLARLTMEYGPLGEAR